MKEKGRAVYVESRNKAKKVIANAMDEEAKKRYKRLS